MPTYAALRTECMIECGVKSDDTAAQTLFLQYIQSAMDDIVSKCGHMDFMQISEEIITEDGTVDYDLQIGAAEIVALQHKSEGLNIRYLPETELVTRGYILTDTGKPFYFYDHQYLESTGRYSISLYPVPDAEYTLYALERRNTKIFTVGLNCFLPQRFIPALKDKVKMQFNLFDGSPERVVFFKREYDEKMFAILSDRQRARRIILGEAEYESPYRGDDYVEFWNP